MRVEIKLPKTIAVQTAIIEVEVESEPAPILNTVRFRLDQLTEYYVRLQLPNGRVSRSLPQFPPLPSHLTGSESTLPRPAAQQIVILDPLDYGIKVVDQYSGIQDLLPLTEVIGHTKGGFGTVPGTMHQVAGTVDGDIGTRIRGYLIKTVKPNCLNVILDSTKTDQPINTSS